MCKPASMIVAKSKTYWSPNTDSHHEIISEFHIKETDARGNINIVPVEIYPEDGNLNTPVSKWKFSIDHAGYEKDLPDWWDADKYEKEVRAAVKHWKKQKVITRKTAVLSGGQYYIYADVGVLKDSKNTNVCAGGSVNEVYGSVNIVREGGSVNEVWGSVNTVCVGGSVNEVWAGGTIITNAGNGSGS